MKKHLSIFITFLFLLVLTGCHTSKQIVYLQDVPQADSIFAVQTVENIKIRPGDKLSIIVNTSIPELAATYNLAVPYRYVGGNSTFSSNQTQMTLYTVDSNGEIDFPGLGNIKVSGMTRQEIAKTIKERLIAESLLKDAVVSVDYGNLTFSVMGEVAAPGRYSFDKDQITILEAISMAHDLTIMGRRDNVLVTRTDSNGNLTTYRVDLRNTRELVASPVYHLQQNDIIYVEPNATKSRQSIASGNTVLTPSFWISVASLLTTITALIIK